VVVATYNRSNVLRHALESVQRSSLRDWEAVVVDDASTDDTADVVRSLRDPRIRLLRQRRNFGEQSGPNNLGVREARAPVVAFLNHDDLYFPDHLERSLAALERSGADLVWCLMAGVRPASGEELRAGRARFEGFASAKSRRYKPSVYAPASGWVLRREMALALGGWRPASELLCEPSQDFLFRAWRAGYDLRQADHLGVLAIQSGLRPDVYRRREDEENAHYARLVAEDPGFRERILTRIAADGVAFQTRTRLRPLRALRCRALERLGALLGVHPRGLDMLLRLGGRGRLVPMLRARRGLDPEPAKPADFERWRGEIHG